MNNKIKLYILLIFRTVLNMCRCIFATQVFKQLILTTSYVPPLQVDSGPLASCNRKSYSFTHLVSDKTFFIAQLNALQMENTDTIGSDILDIKKLIMNSSSF